MTQSQSRGKRNEKFYKKVAKKHREQARQWQQGQSSGQRPKGRRGNDGDNDVNSTDGDNDVKEEGPCDS